MKRDGEKRLQCCSSTVLMTRMATKVTPTRTPSERAKRRASEEPGNGGKPTIRAVAELAQVAISTVSRVLNGGPVSAAVQARVNQAIAELGYTPSLAAQSLVGRKSNTVGLVTDSTESRWFSQVLLGIEEALTPSRKSLVLASLMSSGKYDASQVRAWIHEKRVDGIIFVRSSVDDVELLRDAQQSNMPIVLIGPDVEEPATFTVRGNNLDAGRLAAEHLIDLGHRRIGFGGGPQSSLDTQMRLKGVSERLEESEHPIDRSLVWNGLQYSTQAGIQHAQRFLALSPSRRPTAMILGSDAMALGFMRAVLSAGLRVPEDVSVVGFDGLPDGEVFWPSLTTVRQPTQQMAAHACEALLSSLTGPKNTSGESSVEYPMELVVRESTRGR
jgi:LacI family transcriptional regulator